MSLTDKYLKEQKEIQFFRIWQGKDGSHPSSLSVSDKYNEVTVVGVITHGSRFMFDRKEVPKIIKLLKQKKPLVLIYIVFPVNLLEHTN